MGLPKGKTNNILGKPKGTLSKKTIAWEQLGDKITGEHTDNINKYLDNLYKTDKEAFFRAYTLLLEYFKPKQARQELVGKDGKDLMPTLIQTVSPEEAERIKELSKKLNESQ